MATTPEEFFMEGLMNLSPPSPSVLLDLPQMTNDVGQDSLCPDEIVLSYVSSVLMEDQSEDKLLCQDTDHPSLLQVQKPFSQILSSPSFSTNSDNTVNRDNIEGARNLFQDCSGDQCTLRSSLSIGALAAGSVLKGMEEASRFLSEDNVFRKDQQLNQMTRESGNSRVFKKRYNRDEDGEVGRAYKVFMMMEELEEMFDKMMLRGYETCIEEMKKLRITKADEAKNKKKGYNKRRSNVVDLYTLLINCAQAVSASNFRTAHELLKQIKQHASATGDATQRLAQCFAKGLEARLMGTGRQLWQLLTLEQPLAIEYLKAYNLYMATCSFNRVALFFNVMTIEHAMVGKSKLHIVDYGPHHGFQWAGLLRWMANREGGPPEVRITAISRLQPRSCPSEGTDDTGRRLDKCAREFGVPFKFHAITAKWETISIDDLKTEADEVLVVVDLFSFSILREENIYFDGLSSRDTVLNNIRKMRPDVFIQGIMNCSHSTSFLTRFREALFSYSALFDMLDATIPRDSKLRPVLEQNMLGHSVLNLVACEGADVVNRPEKYRRWQVRNQRAGLRQLPLKPNIVKVLKDKVMKDHHKDFFISEDGQWLLQGWMGRIFYAHSTWVAEDTISE
ncbi:hypothetical protein SORBI_3005G230600 [Sorghum bicolor]|uniref:Uncharacterized protein n=1 Tax=Sorghum bicolor TaxID=4558 RepID=A0A1B6PU83_SORBI|nr:hypothetical protein SORBI_3005G230600 [Sorghum bicolor]